MTLSQKLRVPIELEDVPPHGFGLEPRPDDAPAVRAVDAIFESALMSGASDIHLEPGDGSGRVRERIDGALRDVRTLPPALFAGVISRMKVLSGMNIADRRLPQDGRYRFSGQGRTIDARIGCVPTIDGEKIAVRLLGNTSSVPSLESLGMPDPMVRTVRTIFARPSGLVVVCGPTGSGKTTTLYSALTHGERDAMHLCTIEDPVEFRIAGATQVEVNARAGLTFASGLRALLRLDPDLLMVGETRDAETCAIAASAALCGRLVVTTLHAIDAIAAIERLCDLGMTPAAITAVLSAVVSQRLVRRLCVYCKPLDGKSMPAGGNACEHCEGRGYKGRVGLFELLVVDDAMRLGIASGASGSALRVLAAGAGHENLAAIGNNFVRDGVTSAAEVRRSIGELQDARRG